MRQLFTLLFAILILQCCPAQYVTIPDANFRSFLQQHYPGCFNASDQLDTTCAGILSATTLTLPPLGNTIATLEGIQYFKSLEMLDCSFANVAYIPSLPLTLKSFICQNNGLASWPALPPALEVFNCSECGVTSLPALPASLRTLDCSNNPALTTLPALPPLLTTLNCVSCQLTSLPALPPSLVTLNCSENPALEQLPALPSSLQFLYVSACHILTIPDPLPVALKEFDCSSNVITTIPALPNGLQRLNCRTNQVSALPVLPTALVYFTCGQNRIASLPPLPTGLTELYCYSNQLTALPVLPAGLKILSCGANLFGNSLSLVSLPDGLQSFYCEAGNYTALPSILPPSLVYLHCGSNRLTSLPPLPSTLKNLICYNNQLNYLPDLPTNLQTLECGSNNIYCLPKLPQSTSTDPFFLGLQITFDADKIKCIPNRPANLNLEGNYPNGGSSIYTLPLCNPSNNEHQCKAFPVISGTVFYDSNTNGVRDTGEALKPNIAVQLSNGSRAYTDHNGYFEIGVDSLISYTITTTPPFYFNTVPASNTYRFTTYDTIVSSNYALQANTAIDSLAIRIIPLNWAARPGFDFLYLISYENLGTTALSPTINFLFEDTKLIYDSSSNAAVTHNASSLSLLTGALTPGSAGSFVAYFRLFPNISLNDNLSANATITAGTYTNSVKSTVPVRGAFDPNDKQATPQLSPAQVANGEYIDYTIRFQNTGTDTAFNVVISDTLSSMLQANTLQMIAASHNCKTTVKDNVVFFEFLNILLPDSNVNEVKSHGFVSFKIKPQNNVSVNSSINNKAAIYFDYNAPVITNTASTLIKEFITVPLKLVSFSAVPQNDNTTTLYWNTANEINSNYFVIESGTDGFHFNSVATIAANGMANNAYNASVADNNTGIVFFRLKMVDKDGRFTYSPIIKIDRRKNTSGISILSNPVKDVLIISSSNASLHSSTALIINSNGAVVKSFVVKEGAQMINIKSLPAGLYYIKTMNGSNRILVL